MTADTPGAQVSAATRKGVDGPGSGIPNDDPLRAGGVGENVGSGSDGRWSTAWHEERSLGWNEDQSYAGHDLRHATLDLCSFKWCDFSGANLRGASFRGAAFLGCNLRNADQRDTDLTDAHFGRVLTHSPDHGLTDVTGAQWDGATLRRTVHEDVVGWPSDGFEADA